MLTIRTYASNSFTEPLKTQSKHKSGLQFLFMCLWLLSKNDWK